MIKGNFAHFSLKRVVGGRQKYLAAGASNVYPELMI